MNKKSVRSKYRPEYPKDFIFDFKDPFTLSRFIMEGGKIIPSRISKLSMRQQREVSNAVKRARSLALLPVGNDAYDMNGKPDVVEPKPFDFQS